MKYGVLMIGRHGPAPVVCYMEVWYHLRDDGVGIPANVEDFELIEVGSLEEMQAYMKMIDTKLGTL